MKKHRLVYKVFMIICFETLGCCLSVVLFDQEDVSIRFYQNNSIMRKKIRAPQ